VAVLPLNGHRFTQSWTFPDDEDARTDHGEDADPTSRE
jgi:hypothetical protein